MRAVIFTGPRSVSVEEVEDAGIEDPDDVVIPWATFFAKGISIGFGRTHDRRYTTLLRDLIISGRARPGMVVTHHAPLAGAPALYQAFDQRRDGVIKAVLHPAG